MAIDPLGGGFDAEERGVRFVAMLGIRDRHGLGPCRGERGCHQRVECDPLLVGMAAVDGDGDAEETDSHRDGDQQARRGLGERSARGGHEEGETHSRRHDRRPVQQMTVRAVRDHAMERGDGRPAQGFGGEQPSGRSAQSRYEHADREGDGPARDRRHGQRRHGLAPPAVAVNLRSSRGGTELNESGQPGKDEARGQTGRDAGVEESGEERTTAQRQTAVEAQGDADVQRPLVGRHAPAEQAQESEEQGRAHRHRRGEDRQPVVRHPRCRLAAL